MVLESHPLTHHLEEEEEEEEEAELYFLRVLVVEGGESSISKSFKRSSSSLESAMISFCEKNAVVFIDFN